MFQFLKNESLILKKIAIELFIQSCIYITLQCLSI